MWDQQIRDSDIFMVLGTEAYFQDAICTCQVQYAKDLGKDFFILLKEGVELPDKFLEGVKNFKIEKWEQGEDLVAATNRLLLEYERGEK